MALYEFKFPLAVLVQQEMANITQGSTSTSHGVHETEEVGETNCSHEQDMAEEPQQMVHEQPQLEVDDNEDDVGGMANLELIDPVIDVKHHLHLVDGQLPPVLWLRTHDECWRLDARWIPSDVSEDLVSYAERLEANPPRVSRMELANGLRRLAQRCMRGLRHAT
ncbi:hypothetical protein C2845_PM01G44190 [Panicum miliaceum]|uniref:Uncharacterized protein n=1 Tax=Panicum miliaceum TaxID=4540 RepID=A0A3L6TL16_PANMI|nr:hypothetical protein C2845_PM01G44190 [Panicum miliaceum]